MIFDLASLDRFHIVHSSQTDGGGGYRTIRYCPKNSRVNITTARSDYTRVALGLSACHQFDGRTCRAAFSSRTVVCLRATPVIAAKRGRLPFAIIRLFVPFPSDRFRIFVSGQFALRHDPFAIGRRRDPRDWLTDCRRNRSNDGAHRTRDASTSAYKSRYVYDRNTHESQTSFSTGLMTEGCSRRVSLAPCRRGTTVGKHAGRYRPSSGRLEGAKFQDDGISGFATNGPLIRRIADRERYTEGAVGVLKTHLKPCCFSCSKHD